MSKPKGQATADSPPASSALLFCGEQTTAEERDLTRILDFFAIPWKALRACDSNADKLQGSFSVVSSVACLAEVLRDTRGLGETLPPWITKAHTVYVYGFRDNAQS